MATSKQTQAAKRNVKKAQQSAASKKTITHMTLTCDGPARQLARLGIDFLIAA